ncbi:MAG: hypothetical protein JST58_10630 [Bacteroidetes bacterium]|nr:hypothetical protein [Bacteroidota bacterium]
MEHHFDSSAKAGVMGGTLLTIFVNLTNEDIVKTIVLAAIGAVVSFCITVILKFLIKLMKK